ncbi:MAG: protein translocase subunit SecD [Minisyncoccia bacterium]
MDKSAKLVLIFLIAFFCFNFIFPDILNISFFKKYSFHFGLDLQGGTSLTYKANLTNIPPDQQKSALESLKNIIEKRVNLFGVKEPEIRLENVAGQARLQVNLAGVQNINEAIEMIGKTPYLEFKEEDTENTSTLSFKSTQLTGRYLKRAELEFNPNTYEPVVLLEFNEEGAKIFEELTEKNVGKRLAIFIDGNLISAPQVREKITGGKAQITGKFTVEKAKELVKNLNAGALPVPIELVSQETIGPILGKIYLDKSLKVGILGLISVMVYMIIFYRFLGLVADIGLIFYAGILLSLFKAIPVTLTLPGIAGLVLSIGMAVDANVLIFERFKEEKKAGKNFSLAIKESFQRAWPSIRDSNFTTLLIALIMFVLGSSFIQGFALTLSLGILISMFTAIFITRSILELFENINIEKVRFILP